MNTPTTNYIEIDGEGKWIEDTDAREMATQNADNITAINAKIPASASASNKMATMADLNNINKLTQIWGNGYNAYKYGDVVFLGMGPLEQSITIDERLKPKTGVPFAAWTPSDNKFHLLMVNTDGSITISGLEPQWPGAVFANIVYLAATAQ